MAPLLAILMSIAMLLGGPLSVPQTLEVPATVPPDAFSSTLQSLPPFLSAEVLPAIGPDHRFDLHGFSDSESEALAESLGEEHETSEDAVEVLPSILGLFSSGQPCLSRSLLASRVLIDSSLRNVRSTCLRL